MSLETGLKDMIQNLLGIYLLLGIIYLLWDHKRLIIALKGETYGNDPQKIRLFICVTFIVTVLVWPLYLIKSSRSTIKGSQRRYIIKHSSDMFKAIAKEKGEELDGCALMIITSKFVKVYEQFGLKMYEEHLRYELEQYREEGLREDYRI